MYTTTPFTKNKADGLTALLAECIQPCIFVPFAQIQQLKESEKKKLFEINKAAALERGKAELRKVCGAKPSEVHGFLWKYQSRAPTASEVQRRRM